MELNEAAEAIKREYEKKLRKSDELNAIYKRAKNGTASMEDATEFASMSGKALGEVSKAQLLKIFPEETPSFDELMEILPPAFKDNYKNVAELYKRIRKQLNRYEGLDLGAIAADYPADRVEGLIRLISEMQNIAEEFDSLIPKIENASMSTVDDSTRENVDYASRLGFKTTVIREFHPEETDQSAHHEKGYWECPWCKEVAGVYDYDEVKDTGNDVWRRHDGCHCVITYKSERRTDTIYNGIRPRPPDNTGGRNKRR